MTNWRERCAELLQALEAEGYAHWTVTPDKDELCLRTRAELAQPEPELTQAKILDLADDCGFDGQEIAGWDGKEVIKDHGWECTDSQLVAFARAVRAWGQPAQPDPKGAGQWSEGICGDGAAILRDGVMVPIEEVVASLNRAEQRTAQPDPEGPSEHIISIAKAVQKCAFGWEPDVQVIGNVCAEDVADLCSAILARWGSPPIKPVPVAERLPGEGDCDAEGRCWWWIVDQPGELPHWIYCQLEVLSWTNFTAWLPHWALPVPTPNDSQPSLPCQN